MDPSGQLAYELYLEEYQEIQTAMDGIERRNI